VTFGVSGVVTWNMLLNCRLEIFSVNEVPNSAPTKVTLAPDVPFDATKLEKKYVG
jgi:hypothetical protein